MIKQHQSKQQQGKKIQWTMQGKPKKPAIKFVFSTNLAALATVALLSQRQTIFKLRTKRRANGIASTALLDILLSKSANHVAVKKEKEKEMGLDMFAYKTRNHPQSSVDFDNGQSAEFFYWRKHPNLHGWMENLYREKGGKDESFNCVNVLLTIEDLDRLEADINEGKLPPTSGFFFGQSTGAETEKDLEFIKMARREIADGFCVFYTSWW